jgi:hypothetical protein
MYSPYNHLDKLRQTSTRITDNLTEIRNPHHSPLIQKDRSCTHGNKKLEKDLYYKYLESPRRKWQNNIKLSLRYTSSITCVLVLPGLKWLRTMFMAGLGNYVNLHFHSINAGTLLSMLITVNFRRKILYKAC